MFKGTNKIWKGLALLLVLCMLPTVALAADTEATVAFVGEPKVSGTPEAVTVTAEISKKDTDITILAFRSSSEATAVPVNVEELKAAVVYIDQETAAEAVEGTEKGKHTFTFIPRSVTGAGKYVNIFIGGENVAKPEHTYILMANAAPKVTAPEKLYKGQDLVLTVAAPSVSEYNFAAWEEDIAKVEVNDTEVAYTYADNKLTIANALVSEAEITAIKITGEDYADVEVPVTDGKWYDKEAGSLTIADAEIIAGATVSATLTESAQGGWAAKLAASDLHTINGEPFTGLAISGTDVTLTVPAVPGEYNIVLKAANYADYEVAKITVLSPTAYEKGQIEAAVAALKAENKAIKEFYAPLADQTYPDDEALKDQMYGKRFVDVSAITVGNDTTLTWTFEPALTGADGVYELTRSADADVTYTLTGTITKDGFDPATVTKVFTVTQIGVAGVDFAADPTAKFPAADAAKLATVTLKSGDSVVATVTKDDSFTFKAVAAGAYTLEFARPGYVTLSIEITVTNEGATFEIPKMVAGDIKPDGVVDGLDVSALGSSWASSKGDDTFADAADLNGDGTVDGLDVSALGSNWGYEGK